jgi:mono/diheme cytochrome c family protein
MKRNLLSIFLLLTAYCLLLPAAYASDTPTKPKLAKTPEAIEKGKLTFFRRCSFCHGLLGDGNGPAAQFLDPRPRDFTPGTFKFRTTQSGELPLDENLFRTISRGLKGTAMQAFDNEVIKNGLTEEERWQVIYYIQTFAQEFADPELDPYKKIVKPSMEKIPYSAESVAKGKEVFERAKCWECHGKGGKGDGQKTMDKKDDWGFPIRIRNVTQPWKIKSGSEPEDIFMRLSTGINGTPMPSFIDTLKEEDRWHLANFIKSLQKSLADEEVLKALSVKGEIPEDVNSPEWQKVSPIDIRMSGSVHAAPRWQNPSIEMATVRALYNEKEIGFLIEWDDPFKDVVHKKDMEFDPAPLLGTASYNSYINPVKMITRKLETFRDSIAIQFPVELLAGTEKPHLFRGDASNPVNLWIWKADMDEAGKPSVEETNAVGHDQPLEVQASQDVKGKGVYNGGVWKVIMKRPFTTKDENDIQFKKGKFIPFSLNAWDGSNGEHGQIMSVSSWRFVLLELPTPSKVYVYTILGVVLAGLGELWLVRKNSR